MKYVTGALAIIAVIAIVVFSLQNLASVEVSFLVWSVNASKVLIIVVAYLLGMVSGWGLVELTKWFVKQG